MMDKVTARSTFLMLSEPPMRPVLNAARQTLKIALAATLSHAQAPPAPISTRVNFKILVL